MDNITGTILLTYDSVIFAGAALASNETAFQAAAVAAVTLSSTNCTLPGSNLPVVAAGALLAKALETTEVYGVTGWLQLAAGQHQRETGFTLSNLRANGSKVEVGRWDPATRNLSLTPGKEVYWGPNASGAPRDSHWAPMWKYFVASPALGVAPPLYDFEQSMDPLLQHAYIPDLLRYVLQRVSFPMEPVLYPNYPNYTGYNGMLRYIGSSHTDVYIGLTDARITATRSQYVDFGTGFLSYGSQVIVLKGKSAPNFWAFFLPFSTDMWLALMATLLVIFLFTWAVERERNPNFKRRLGGVRTVIELYRDPSKHAVTLSGQLTQVVFTVLAKLVVAAYTANFAAVLVLANTAAKIHDLNDISKTSPIGTMCGWAMEPWLRSLGYNNIVCFQNHQAENSQSMADQIEKGLTNNLYVAFFMTTPELALITKLTECRLQGVGKSYQVLPTAFQFNKKVPAYVKHELNAALIEAWDSGFLASLQVNFLLIYRVFACRIFISIIT